MDMSTMTTTTGMSGMAMTTASSASSTSTMDMSSMSSMPSMPSSSSMMTSAEMPMLFFQSVSTPLFSSNWTPSGSGAYAGICIFIIALAVIHRLLLAVRHVFFESTSRRAHGDEKLLSNGEDYGQVRAARVLKAARESHPFRVLPEAARGLFEVVTSGVGYLLMLAVMTMNVGYFLSVLGGIFLGTFLVGRFGPVEEHH